MIINSIGDLKEFNGSMELATLLDNEIKGQRYILTKVDNRIILMCKENTVEDVEGLDKIIYYLARNIYETMCVVDDYIWFKDEEVLREYFTNEFSHYKEVVDDIKSRSIYNINIGDIILIGGNDENDIVKFAESFKYGLSTGFIVKSLEEEKEGVIIRYCNNKEKFIPYESIVEKYNNINDYIEFLRKEFNL